MPQVLFVYNELLYRVRSEYRANRGNAINRANSNQTNFYLVQLQQADFQVDLKNLRIFPANYFNAPLQSFVSY